MVYKGKSKDLENDPFSAEVPDNSWVGGYVAIAIGCLIILAVITLPFVIHKIDKNKIVITRCLDSKYFVLKEGFNFVLCSDELHEYNLYNHIRPTIELRGRDARLMRLTYVLDYRIIPEQIKNIHKKYRSEENFINSIKTEIGMVMLHKALESKPTPRAIKKHLYINALPEIRSSFKDILHYNIRIESVRYYIRPY